MTVDEWTQIIAQYGFPIVVAAWFMFRLEKILKEHNYLIVSLKVLIERHLETFK